MTNPKDPSQKLAEAARDLLSGMGNLYSHNGCYFLRETGHFQVLAKALLEWDLYMNTHRQESLVVSTQNPEAGNPASPQAPKAGDLLDEPVRQLPDIGTHLCQAIADGRYDDSPSRRALFYGRHESRRPTDPLPRGIKFGGQISMDDPLPNTEVAGSSPAQ